MPGPITCRRSAAVCFQTAAREQPSRRASSSPETALFAARSHSTSQVSTSDAALPVTRRVPSSAPASLFGAPRVSEVDK